MTSLLLVDPMYSLICQLIHYTCKCVYCNVYPLPCL